jgi:ATP-dependent Lhr-like helicase
MRAQSLLAVARATPRHPLVLETFRECLQDAFDLDGLTATLRRIRERSLRVEEVETRSPSAFARSLVFAFVAVFAVRGRHAPLAERRSPRARPWIATCCASCSATTELRELLDVRALDEVERLLQGLAPETKARHADGLHDRLRQSGDATDDELAARYEGSRADYRKDRDALVDAKRIVALDVAGESRWIAVEDAAVYRDGLGIALPAGLPPALLEPAAAPLEQLVMRHARCHSAFTTASLAARLGLRVEGLDAVLDSLARRGRLFAGELDPRRTGREWCEPEVLRRVKKKTLARLREEIEPVEGEGLGRFLQDWHGITRPQRGRARLDEVIDRLEGLPLSFAELERAILPARIADFEPGLLDEAGSEGRLVWIGAGAIGERDGRVALFRRERLAGAGAAFEARVALETPSPLAQRIHEVLAARGASFFLDLVAACPGAPASAVEEALWSLVWGGLVTNDTFAPLRARRAPIAKRPRRPGRHAPPSSTAGRWSLVATLFAEAGAPTERLHRRVVGLLERHAIVSRECLEGEAIAGGFGTVYPVLREMEEAGRVRRGHFCVGASSAQFALPGVVDRLRAFRGRPVSPQAVVLAALDPAQPYGAQIPWPALRSGRARRAVGTAVVLVDGAPVLFVERGGRSLLSFADEIDDARRLAALGALAAAAGRLGVRRLSVEQVDGAPAREGPFAALFERAGFRSGYRGYEIERTGR